ncbi:MAG: zinc-ribbon domain-containing protein [Oscillospiraceae bacterium]|nr:zinc-ribbon domain-containing protein [Oscillospiraceae bacterium]
MFCQNCGKQIAEDARFCPGCGAAVGGQPRQAAYQAGETSRPNEQAQQYQQPQYQQAPYQQPQQDYRQPQTAKKQKKKTPVWLVILVALAAFLIGKFVISPAMLTDSGSNKSTAGNTNSSNSSVSSQFPIETTPTVSVNADAVDTANSAYTEIFSSRYIVEDMAPSSMLLLDTNSYAIVYDYGGVERMLFGYSNDKVLQLVDTLYYPVSGYTEDQLAQLETTLKDYYAIYEQLSFCTVTYTQGTSYYKIVMTMTDLDKSANIQALSGTDLLTTAGADWISMSQSESDLLASGFVKK